MTPLHRVLSAHRGARVWLALLCITLLCRTVPAATVSGSEGKRDKPEPPAFSVPGKVFSKPLKVALPAPQGLVRFSTDGTEPEANSRFYKEPIEITNCVVVRARTFLPDGSSTAIRTESYFLAGDDLKSFKSSLPIVIINSLGEEITSTEKAFASVTILSNTTGQATLTSDDNRAFLALLHVRGHSSLRYPKHSYAMKAVNELRDSQKVSVLGLSKESDWVLYGPYPDKTLMRDMLAYELSNAMGRWAPHGRFVEVFVNENSAVLSMSHYAGVYVLLEKVLQQKERVDIAKLSPGASRAPEISGGYIFKKDHAGISERKKFGAEGPPQAGQVNDRTGYPTPPGGFPADPAGFLPPYGKATAGNKAVPARTTRALSPASPPKTKKAKAKPTDPSQPRTNHIALNELDGMGVEFGGDALEEDGFRTSLKR